MPKLRNESPLCCCEYYNIQGERSSILKCCCDCEDLDESFERFITCKRVPSGTMINIINILQDRFRIPWRGGAKQLAADAFLPIILLPVLAYVAAQNLWCTILVFGSTLLTMCYVYYIFLKVLPHTKFFIVWTLTSIVLLLLVFEITVVPLLEILPEENFVFVGLVIFSMICIHRTRVNAVRSHITSSESAETLMGKASENVCSVCRKKIPARTYHCRICHACVVKKDHHCAWLDCCICESNHRMFVMGLCFCICALVYGSILTLTSVCHPSFFFMEILLLPDDCSDVYHELDIALCFVSALYCLIVAGLLLLMLLHQLWLISLGLTGQEWRDLQSNERKCGGLNAVRPYSKGFLRNWVGFICCRR